MSHVATKPDEFWAAADPAEALLALYRQPPLDTMKAPAFGPPSEPTLAASELLDRAVLNEQLAYFGRTYGDDADRKAVASIWSKFHFSSVSIPTLVANLLLGYDLPLGGDELRLALGDKGQTVRIWLPHGGVPLASKALQGASVPCSMIIVCRLSKRYPRFPGCLPRCSGAISAITWNSWERPAPSTPISLARVCRCWIISTLGRSLVGAATRSISRCAIWNWAVKVPLACGVCAASSIGCLASRCAAAAR